MKRITVNALVDIGCLITFIPTLVTGLILYFYLPEGGFRSGWVTYLGMTRNQWLTIHDYVSFMFAALLIVHLLLHWKFFRNIGWYLKPGENRESDIPE
ncbi:MAG: hypothetical protein A4E35_00537 [Methanoregula sp. PtaU1.Bin051]|nr:MAG: hypothetical protein A4E35_00537 [Methanoregula sp. PtaU1.Bin051]